MQEVLKIIEAKYLHDYVIYIKFNTNEEVNLDLQPMIKEDKIGIFKPLEQIEYFSDFHLDYTLCWGQDIDVAPEYLFFLANKTNKQYRDLFKQWGYLI